MEGVRDSLYHLVPAYATINAVSENSSRAMTIDNDVMKKAMGFVIKSVD